MYLVKKIFGDGNVTITLQFSNQDKERLDGRSVWEVFGPDEIIGRTTQERADHERNWWMKSGPGRPRYDQCRVRDLVFEKRLNKGGQPIARLALSAGVVLALADAGGIVWHRPTGGHQPRIRQWACNEHHARRIGAAELVAAADACRPYEWAHSVDALPTDYTSGVDETLRIMRRAAA